VYNRTAKQGGRDFMRETSSQNAGNPKRRIHGLLLALIVLACAMGGLFWLLSGFGRLSASIFGGSSTGLSNSMELFELRFRTSAKDVTPLEADSLPRKEWILNIPRAFVVSTIGDNGAYGPDDSFFARLELVFDPKTETVTPLTMANKSNFPSKSVNVKLENGANMSALSKVDYCVRYDDLFAFMTKFESDYPFGGECDSKSPRCEVFANLDGWPIRIHMPRYLYFSDPQPVCRMVEAFLVKHTTRRDIVN
jgi:hypothetical protein